MNSNDQYYEFYERVAILMDGNPGMTELQAKEKAKEELLERRSK